MLAAAVPLGIADALVRRADRALSRLGRQAGDDRVVYDLADWGTS